jgi:hypothetical protein
MGIIMFINQLIPGGAPSCIHGVYKLAHHRQIFDFSCSAETLINIVITPTVVVMWCHIMAKSLPSQPHHRVLSLCPSMKMASLSPKLMARPTVRKEIHLNCPEHSERLIAQCTHCKRFQPMQKIWQTKQWNVSDLTYPFMFSCCS